MCSLMYLESLNLVSMLLCFFFFFALAFILLLDLSNHITRFQDHLSVVDLELHMPLGSECTADLWNSSLCSCCYLLFPSASSILYVLYTDEVIVNLNSILDLSSFYLRTKLFGYSFLSHLIYSSLMYRKGKHLQVRSQSPSELTLGIWSSSQRW